MVRKSPCLYCQHRRRKCERTSDTEPCKRCLKMNRKCQSRDSSTDYSSEDEIDNSDLQDSIEMVLLYEQVIELDKQIKSMEREKQALVRQEPQWLLELSDGQLRLKSAINNLEEIMMFSQSAIRYLSPFGNTFLSKRLYFERINPSLFRKQLQTVWSHTSIDKPHRAITQAEDTIQPMEARAVIERLIDRYFSCFNDSLPILHEATYRIYFSKLKDPLSDPVTLAVCASSAISNCKHSFLSSHEKRYFGEYYYNLCVEQLLEMFDEPDRAMESLLTINLLQMFMIFTLKLSQARKWSSVALVLAKSLRAEHKHCHEGARFDPSTRIKYAIIHRNYTVAVHLMSFIDLQIHNRLDTEDVFSQPFDILPDDRKQVREWIELTNYIIQLCCIPAFATILQESRLLLAGHHATLSFEEVIRFEEIVRSWWDQLPIDIKICKNPFELTQEIINQCTDVYKLMFACTLHVITLSMQSAFVQPVASKENENLNGIVRNKAISMVIHSAGMCFHLTKQIEISGATCYSLSRIIIVVIDSMLSILNTLDPYSSSIIKSRAQDYLSELGSYFSADNIVSPVASPLSVLSVASSSSTPSVDELYENYPIPGEAMLYDVTRALVEKQINS